MIPYPIDRPGAKCELCGQSHGQLGATARTDGMGEEIRHIGVCPEKACSMCGRPAGDCYCVPSE